MFLPETSLTERFPITGVWFGNTKVGVRLELKGDDPLWWAGSPTDNGNSPKPPDSWHNEGAGGIDAYHNGTASFYSGMRPMGAGESMSYVFSLMVTPVRPFDMVERFRDRWAQGGTANYSELHSKGVTVMNVHQGNPINPWINYPYLTNPANKWAADQCHSLGMKYSVYNTMRELSNRCREYWAMISFGGTLVPAACEHCGGADWLQEHIRTGYLPAWSNPVGKPPCEANSSSSTCSYTHGAIPNPDPEVRIVARTHRCCRSGHPTATMCDSAPPWALAEGRVGEKYLSVARPRRDHSCRTPECGWWH